MFISYWGCLLGCSSKRTHRIWFTKRSGSRITQCQIFWFDPAKLFRSWSALSVWVVALKCSGLPWCWCGDRGRSLARSSPWIEGWEATCWRKGEGLLPAVLSQSSTLEFRAKAHWTFLFNANLPEVLKLCKPRSTKAAKTSNAGFSSLLTAMSSTKSNSFWVSGKSKTAECPRRGFLGIYVPSARRMIIKAWIFLLSWETKKNHLNSLNSSCQAVKYIPFMPVSCCLFSLCVFL